MRSRALLFLALPASAVLLFGCDGGRPLQPNTPDDADASVASSVPPVAAPTAIKVVASSPSTIDVGWQDNAGNETGYEVHRSTTGETGSYALLVALGVDVTTYGDQGLASNTQYCYRVRAVRVVGNKTSYSAFSNAACATPPMATPAAPTEATAVAPPTGGEIDLAWKDNASNETGYEAQWSTGGATGDYYPLVVLGANVTTYGRLQLPSDRQFCFRVRAFLTVGDKKSYSDFSNTTCATTPLTVAEAAYDALASPLSSSSVAVTWRYGWTSVDGFRVYRSTDGGATWSLAAAVTSVQPFVDAGRASEQAVCYRVLAFNSLGESAPSNTTCTAPPAAPTNLVGTVGDDAVIGLTWTDNSAVEETYQLFGYYVQPPCTNAVCDAGGSYEGYVLLAELPANTTSFRCDICAGMQITWGYVVAVKNGGQSDIAYWSVPVP